MPIFRLSSKKIRRIRADKGESQMPLYHSAAVTAHRLKISKTLLLMRAKEGRVRPEPIKVNGKANSPWLFSPIAKIIA